MNALLAIIGFLILVAGHQLNWLYVGGICVLLTNHILTEFQVALSPMDLIVYSLAAGVIGILLTYYLQKIMVVLTTAVAGAYLSYYLPSVFGWNTNWLSWITIVTAGVACAVLIIVWYSIPLSIFSALIGATIIIQNIKFGTINTLAIFFVLCILGISTQWILMRYSTSESS